MGEERGGPACCRERVYHDRMDTVNPVLRETILRVVRKQIHDGDPPEAKETFDRLRREGHSAQEAYRLLGCVLTAEIYDIEKEKRTFDRERYVKRLRALPQLPWDEPLQGCVSGVG
jgi:hypothetical protein